MQVIELYDLLNWIEKEIIAKKIVQKYQNLVNTLNTNIQANQQKQPLAEHKSNLIDTIKAVPLIQLTNAQLEFLEKLQIGNHVGIKAADEIENLLYKNVIDEATSARALQTFIDEINTGITRIKQIREGLKGLIDEDSSPVERGDEVLLRIIFSQEAAISNVVDFKQWGETWHEIGRGVSLVHDLTPEDIKIVGATTGSIIFDCYVAKKIANTLSNIALGALQIAERYYEVRQQAEKLRGMKLANDKIAQDLEAEAQRIKDDGAAQILIQINKIEKIQFNGEVGNALERSVNSMIGFIAKGGEIDCAPPESKNTEQAESPELSNLRTNFEQIRSLREKLKLLEHQDSPQKPKE